MQFSTFTAIALLGGLASAKTCMNITIPMTLSARQGIFNIAIPSTDPGVTNFVLNATKQGGNFTNTALTGYGTTMGNYSISAMFCAPTGDTSANPTVQVLTHGIGFDKGYWSLPYNNYNYSYVDVATDKYKYSTLSFDRLGIGMSSHGEPLNEIQAPLEVAALYKITQMLRAGTIPGVPLAFKKVVHVGHSFGSGQTYAMVNMYPDSSDGIVLTGFSMNPAFLPIFLAGANFVTARGNQPLRFGPVTGTVAQTFLDMYAGPLVDYLAPIDLTVFPTPQNLPTGYIISSNMEANKFLFLKSMFYPTTILDLAERTKQPVTLGELLTLGSLPMMNNYAGPVMVFTGDSDVPFCGGDCLATGDPSVPSIPAAVMKNFPNVSPANFTAYIQPNTAHGLNLHYNATGGYNVINTFFNSKNLMTS